MFHRLAASLNIVFKWLPMSDQVQTFSSNILCYKQMFIVELPYHANLARAAKSKQSRGVFFRFLRRNDHKSFRVNTHTVSQKRALGSLCSMFDQTLLICLAGALHQDHKTTLVKCTMYNSDVAGTGILQTISKTVYAWKLCINYLLATDSEVASNVRPCLVDGRK